MDKRRTRKLDYGNVLVVATIVVCFSLALGLCLILNGGGFLRATFAQSENATTFTLLCQGVYNDVTLARTSAELARSRGAAGYVRNVDGKYDVVLCAYGNADDAQRVMEGLGQSGAYTESVSIPAPTLKWCNDEYHGAVEEALKYFDIAYASFNETANSVVDKSISIDDAKVQKEVLKVRLCDVKSIFYQKVSDCDNDLITDTKLAIVTALALADNVQFDNDRAQTASGLRYAAVQLLLTHQALLLAYANA